MPLCDRLRLNSGRPFSHTLVARLIVVLFLAGLIMFFNILTFKRIHYIHTQPPIIQTYGITKSQKTNLEVSINQTLF